MELAALARVKGRRTVTSSQARFSPVVRQLQLIADGHIGRVLSTRISGHVNNLGPTVTDLAGERYLRERRNGANLLTIPFGPHDGGAARGARRDCQRLGHLERPVSAGAGGRHGHHLPGGCARRHIVVAGHLASGVPLSITYIGGTPPPKMASLGHPRHTRRPAHHRPDRLRADCALQALWERLGTDTQLREIAAATDALQALGPVAGGVARGYQRFADDLRHGTHTAPDFDDAVALHRVLHAIERSAEEGIRIGIDDAGHVVQTGSASLEAA